MCWLAHQRPRLLGMYSVMLTTMIVFLDPLYIPVELFAPT
jgi:hypothetical protein